MILFVIKKRVVPKPNGAKGILMSVATKCKFTNENNKWNIWKLSNADKNGLLYHNISIE